MQKTQYLLINSQDRVSGVAHSFKAYIKPSLDAFKKVELYNVTLPNTIYNITSTNNIIYFSEGSTPLTAIITSGAYNSSTIVAAIGSAMTSASVNSYTYTTTFNSTTFLLTITSTGSFSLTFSTNTLNSAGYILGFTTNTSSGTSQTGNQVIQLNQPLFYYITINQFPICVKSTNQNDMATFVFSSTVNAGDVENYNILQRYCEISTYDSQNLSEIDVKLSLANNQIANLNGGDWIMILKIIY